MKKTITVIEESGIFSLFDFCTSHNQVLYRCHNSNLKQNLDVLFSDTQYLDLPVNFANCKIYIGNSSDRETINKRYDLKGYEKVIVVESEGFKYYVVAINVLFQKNNFPPQETSMPMKREKPITEENTKEIIDNIDRLIIEKGLDYVRENIVQNSGNWELLTKSN